MRPGESATHVVTGPGMDARCLETGTFDSPVSYAQRREGC